MSRQDVLTSGHVCACSAWWLWDLAPAETRSVESGALLLDPPIADTITLLVTGAQPCSGFRVFYSTRGCGSGQLQEFTHLATPLPMAPTKLAVQDRR